MARLSRVCWSATSSKKHEKNGGICSHRFSSKYKGGKRKVICRCGCEFDNSRWDSHVMCPNCKRIYPNVAPDMVHPVSEEERRWKCEQCGKLNETSYQVRPEQLVPHAVRNVRAIPATGTKSDGFATKQDTARASRQNGKETLCPGLTSLGFML